MYTWMDLIKRESFLKTIHYYFIMLLIDSDYYLCSGSVFGLKTSEADLKGQMVEKIEKSIFIG